MDKNLIQQIEMEFIYLSLKYLGSQRKALFNDAIVHEFEINSLAIPIKNFYRSIERLNLCYYSIILDINQKKMLLIE